ncbi:MAG: Ig-like domain-containing protein [Chloroflexota bacterium]|nr:Ig-like domain-containing protein [Chloroflexota bacterium]
MNKRIRSRVAIPVIAVILFSSLAFAPSSNRQVQITIQVVDADNNPVPGATISYRQTSQDFMFSTGWRWGGESTPPELTERIDEIGFNTGHILAFYEWEGVQPEEDVFHWQGLDHAFDTFGTTRPVDEELPNFRHRYVSLGPSFGELSAAPGWVNTDDLDTFQRQYGEYLRQFLTRYRGRVNAYSVLGELEGSAHGLSVEETISWAKWQTGLIREIDPEAVILIQVGDTHWYFPDATEIQIEQATFMPKWCIMETLTDGGVDFDGFAVETHYSMAAPGDWRQLKEAVETLTAYDKYIYIWESFYPSGYNPCVYFNWQELALTPKQVPAEWPYSPETYTESWQQDQLVNTLRTLVENGRVLGYNYGTLAGASFVDGPTSAPDVGFGEDLCDQPSTINLGLVHSDLSPKPGFTALRDYWQSLFASGEMVTDAGGEVVLSGMAGEYEIAVFADGCEQQAIRIHVDESGGNTIQLVVQPQAIAAGEEVEEGTAQEFNTPVISSPTVEPTAGLPEKGTGEADDYGYFLFLLIIPVFICGAVLFVVALWKKRGAK